MITQRQAWTIAREFAGELEVRLGGDLVTVILVGSLAARTYHPGRSDIDTAVVVLDAPAPELAAVVGGIADQYRDRYRVPKGFGAVVIRQGELAAPFDPERGLPTEVLRLKRQGVVLAGEYHLRSVPEPSSDDLRAEMRAFYPWLRANYIDRRPDDARTADALVNTLLYELRLLVWDRTGEYVLDKSEVIPRFLGLAGTGRYTERLRTIQMYLTEEVELLRDLSSIEALLREISRSVRDAVPWSVDP